MSPQLKMMSRACSALATTLRSALVRTNPDGSLCLSPDEVMGLLSSAGVISSNIAILDENAALKERMLGKEEEEVEVLQHNRDQHEVEMALAQESGAQIPDEETMQRAIAAASVINKMTDEKAKALTLKERMELEAREKQSDQQYRQMEQKQLTPVGQKIQDRLRAKTQSQTETSQPNEKPRPTLVHQSTARPIPAPQPQVSPISKTISPESITARLRRESQQRQKELEQAQLNRQARAAEHTDTPAPVVSRMARGEVMPAQREDGYVPAIGNNRDVRTATRDIHSMDDPIPPSEMLAGANATEEYNPIPHVNVNVPSPYSRLTDVDHSEFSKIFAASAYTPDCNGVVKIPHPLFPWYRDVELQTLEGIDLVRRPQGFYGFNPHNGGPKHVLIKLQNSLVIWNFKHTPANCRIFYVGRSNKTGVWYTPEALDKKEIFTIVADLGVLRGMVTAMAENREYHPKALLNL